MRKQAARAQQRGGTEPALKRGPWSPEEDELLKRFVAREGEGRWRTLPRRAGLLRCGKSCRLRWMNYLRPNIKRGPIAADEEDLIVRLHRLLGNRWSLIAGRLPGRTDNEIKNYWNSHISKKLVAQGIDPRTHKPLNAAQSSSNGAAATAAADDNTTKPPPRPPVAEPSMSPQPQPLAPPNTSSGAGVNIAGDDGGSAAFATAVMDLDDGADGFEGFCDEFRAWDDAPRGGFDWGCPVVDDVDDGTFSSFLDSLINDDHQFVHYFGDHKNADGDDKDQGGR